MTPRTLSKTIAIIKRDVQRGNTASLASALESAGSAELLRILREQKVLFQAQPSSVKAEVAALLGSTSRRVLDGSAHERYSNYLDFAMLAVEIAERLTSRVAEILKTLPAISCSSLLYIADRYHEAFLADVTEPSPSSRVARPLREAVAIDERNLHELNGISNTFFFSLVRAFNEASR